MIECVCIEDTITGISMKHRGLILCPHNSVSEGETVEIYIMFSLLLWSLGVTRKRIIPF